MIIPTQLRDKKSVVWHRLVVFSFVVLIVLVLPAGCSVDECDDSLASPVKLSQTKYEIDLEQKILLTHNESLAGRDHRSLKVCVTDLPILHITTDGNKIADDPKVAATLKILQPDRAAVIVPIGIEWRGRTSQTFPKKSYGFELRANANSQQNLKQSLLEMRCDDDWILDALWNEPVNIRDFTAHQIWRSMAKDHQSHGAHALPQQAYCELFLDGRYSGVYYLGEPVDRKMLNVQKPKEHAAGQIFKACDWADATSFKAAPPLAEGQTKWSGFEVTYPESNGDVDWEGLQSLVQFSEQSDSRQFADGIGRQIDLQNAVDYFIFINLLAAMDNRGKNYFLVRQSPQSPWFFVPWDLDLTAGMCFPAQHKDVVELRMYNHLFGRLMACPEFVKALGVRWSVLRHTIFAPENLKSRYRENYQRIAKSGVFDRRQFCPQFKTNFDTPENEIVSIERWIDKRIEFLDGWFGNTAPLVKRLKRERSVRTANSISNRATGRMKSK